MSNGAPVPSNQDSMSAGPRGPLLMQDLWLNEKLGDFAREVIPERRMHAKGSGAFGTFTVTNDITKYTKAKIFSEVGKKTEMFARFTTVAGERGLPMLSVIFVVLRLSFILKRVTGIWLEITRQCFLSVTLRSSLI